MTDAAAWIGSRADWKAAYIAAFVACAMERGNGWTAENAAVWAGEIVCDALSESSGDTVPTDVARVDVVACEWEYANA